MLTKEIQDTLAGAVPNMLARDSNRTYMRTTEDIEALVDRLQELGVHPSHFNTKAEYLANSCDLDSYNQSCGEGKKCRVHIHNVGRPSDTIVWSVCK